MQDYQITVYGSKDCGKCKSARQKIEDFFKLDCQYLDINVFINPHDNFRNDESVDVMAAYQDKGTYPIIRITEGKFTRYYDYPEAMGILKRFRKADEGA